MARKPTSIRLDEDLVEKIRQELTDPVTNKTRYGGMQALIESLLWEWLRKQSQPTQGIEHDSADTATGN